MTDEISSIPSLQETVRVRQRMVLGVVLVVWGVLLLRLIQIQMISADRFASQAQQQQIDQVTMEARPGDILDREGRLLATSLKVPSLFVDPSRVEDVDALVGALRDRIAFDAEKLKQRILNSPEKRFLWVKRHLTAEEVNTLRASDFDWNVIGLREEFKRFYPQGTLATHVLGHRDIDGVGRGGIEQFFDEQLRGRSGVRRYVRDARGRMLEILEEVTVAPQMGTSLILTLDAIIQLYVEQALDDLVEEVRPVGACAIVIDPRNGEVLAMASRPVIDPADTAESLPGAWENSAIMASYEPGSTFKPFVVAWGLEQGLIDIGDQYHCEWGQYRMGPRLLHDHHSYGMLSLAEILIKSSNIGMAKIGERIGNEELFRMATKLGFGRRTGIELPGEANGILRPLDSWNHYSTGSIPMGHEIAVTPIQMIAAHAMLANRGQRVSPHLIRDFAAETESPQQVLVSEIVQPDVARWVVEEAMTGVVNEGTGQRAHVSGLSVFGKTGTAQKFNPAGGYFSDRHICSFVCGAPAENPRVLVLVCVDDPQSSAQSGGAVAAPCASRILTNALRQIELNESRPLRTPGEVQAVAPTSRSTGN